MAFIEYLLDELSDPSAFENMCCEILLKEGYAGINPVGGPNDKGRDAEERLFQGKLGPRMVLFQFTLEKAVRSKVLKTVRRVRESQLQVDQLVMMFNARVSPETRDSLEPIPKPVESTEWHMPDAGSLGTTW